MVPMALDHTRDFSAMTPSFRPLDLTQTYAALFLTRWITHFCAPVFCFLAGTAAFLSLTRGKTKTDLARFLITRGLWLVLLELTVMQFAWTFNFDIHSFGGGVIWALGWSMVALAALIYLPLWAIAAFGIVMIARITFSIPCRQRRSARSAGSGTCCMPEIPSTSRRPSLSTSVIRSYPGSASWSPDTPTVRW